MKPDTTIIGPGEPIKVPVVECHIDGFKKLVNPVQNLKAT
jgi:hypothetical protein